MKTAPTQSTPRGVAADLLDEVERDAGVLSPTTVRAYVVVPWIAAVLFAATALYRPVFRLLMKEDRVLEWAQFALFVLAAAGALQLAKLLYRHDRRALAVAWAGFAIGCAVIAGEEIAWGQRVLGLDTPDSLSEINHQEQITAHNIVGVQEIFNLVFAGAALYGAVTAVAFRWRKRVEPGSVVDLLVPPLFLGSLFVLVFGYKLARFVAFHEARFIVVKYGEYVELCLALAFASFAWFGVRRLRLSLGGPVGPTGRRWWVTARPSSSSPRAR